jgi:hypothetical protein
MLGMIISLENWGKNKNNRYQNIGHLSQGVAPGMM